MDFFKSACPRYSKLIFPHSSNQTLNLWRYRCSCHHRRESSLISWFMCKPGRRFACDLLLKSKLVECLIYVDILQKFVQTAHLIWANGAKSKNKYPSIIVHGLVHATLNLTTCSLFIPCSNFASLRNSHCSCLSSLNCFFTATFFPLALATKTRQKQPWPIGSSLSCNWIQKWQTMRHTVFCIIPYFGTLNWSFCFLILKWSILSATLDKICLDKG